jgi:hypothetical protein
MLDIGEAQTIHLIFFHAYKKMPAMEELDKIAHLLVISMKSIHFVIKDMEETYAKNAK